MDERTAQLAHWIDDSVPNRLYVQPGTGDHPPTYFGIPLPALFSRIPPPPHIETEGDALLYMQHVDSFLADNLVPYGGPLR